MGISDNKHQSIHFTRWLLKKKSKWNFFLKAWKGIIMFVDSYQLPYSHLIIGVEGEWLKKIIGELLHRMFCLVRTCKNILCHLISKPYALQSFNTGWKSQIIFCLTFRNQLLMDRGMVRYSTSQFLHVK